MGTVWTAAFSPDGSRIVTIDTTARIWCIFPTLQDLVDEAKAGMHRCRTQKQRAE